MKSDHEMFTCSEYYKATYVVGLYKDKADKIVRDFLEEKCDSKEINNSTHAEVYAVSILFVVILGIYFYGIEDLFLRKLL